jgi:UDP-N-acetylmuramoyl-L-alanyl-D-glutamate--2,6-diaminopimelate ligase
MRLIELLKKAALIELTGSPDTEISSVAYDSRKASPGAAFVAVKGEKADGRDFIAAAIEKGASAVVHEGDIPEKVQGVAYARVKDARRAMALMAAVLHDQPSSKMRLVGITGTNGKTTTAYLVKSILESGGRTVGLLGTIGYIVGGRTLPAPNTTPESVDLQGLLAEMVLADARDVVMEVSSHAVALKRVAGCSFSVKVFTNFTQDHLDFHGTMEDYFETKKSFFTDYPGANVVNMDDPRGFEIAEAAQGTLLTYGIDNASDITARYIKLRHNGTSFSLAFPQAEVDVSTRLVGRHNIYNIMAAAGACFALGVSPEYIAKGIAGLQEVPGRLESVDAGQDFSVLVDYAHTEDALSHVLHTAREFTRGRLITVFGCGGDRDKSKRPRMGFAAASLSDIIVLTSDNPRSEDPAEIIAHAEHGIRQQGSKTKGETFFVVEDRGQAIKFAIGMARKGDTVVIAGKGHEDYQIIDGKKFHFDDREMARQAIAGQLP